MLLVPCGCRRTGRRSGLDAYEIHAAGGAVDVYDGGGLGMGLAETAHAQKVGVVDLQAVLDQSTRGRSAKDRLRELGDKLQHEVKSKLEFKRQKEEELQKLQTEFRSQKDLLTEQARAVKDEDYRRRARELKRFIDDTNRFTEDATQEFREREMRETPGAPAFCPSGGARDWRT